LPTEGRTEQNIFIRLNKLTEFTTHKKVITGRLPEKPCGSTMLAAPRATYTNNQYMKNRQDRKKTKKESECTTIHKS